MASSISANKFNNPRGEKTMTIDEFDYEIQKVNDKLKQRLDAIKAIIEAKLSNLDGISKSAIDIYEDGFGDIMGKELGAGTKYLRPEIVINWGGCGSQFASDAFSFAKILAEASQMAIDYNEYRYTQLLRLRGLANHIIEEK